VSEPLGWTGPDRSLARMCQCAHNLAQHTYSRGRCDYDYRCGCTRFSPTEGAPTPALGREVTA
jgi:hypothetical protein